MELADQPKILPLAKTPGYTGRNMSLSNGALIHTHSYTQNRKKCPGAEQEDGGHEADEHPDVLRPPNTVRKPGHRLSALMFLTQGSGWLCQNLRKSPQ